MMDRDNVSNDFMCVYMGYMSDDVTCAYDIEYVMFTLLSTADNYHLIMKSLQHGIMRVDPAVCL